MNNQNKEDTLKSPFSPYLVEMCSICGKALPNDDEQLAVDGTDCSLVHVICLAKKIKMKF